MFAGFVTVFVLRHMLVLLPTGHWQAWVFAIAMLAGMLMFRALQARR